MVWGKRMGFEEGKEEEERKKERQKKYCVIKAYIAGIPRQLFWFSGHSIELFFFFMGIPEAWERAFCRLVHFTANSSCAIPTHPLTHSLF